MNEAAVSELVAKILVDLGGNLEWLYVLRSQHSAPRRIERHRLLDDGHVAILQLWINCQSDGIRYPTLS